MFAFIRPRRFESERVRATQQIKARRQETQLIFLTFYGDPELTMGILS